MFGLRGTTIAVIIGPKTELVVCQKTHLYCYLFFFTYMANKYRKIVNKYTVMHEGSNIQTHEHQALKEEKKQEQIWKI